MTYNPYGASALPARYANVQTGAGTTLDLGGLERMMQKLESLKHLDATDLMHSWERIMEEDNRRGILAGLDKDGVPMIKVTYRPKPELHMGKPHSATLRVTQTTGSKSIKETLKQFRRGQKINTKQGAFGGIGASVAGLNNNLTTAEYQLLGGPPLAPRDQFSRFITNYRTDFAELRPGYWAVTFWWEDIVSVKGVAFQRYHFEGTGKLPRRDLRGVRPAGIQKALDALHNWSRVAIHEHFGV